MTGPELLIDAFGRIHSLVRRTVDGLTEEQLTARLDAAANPISWLIWHLTRIQDDHVADAAGVEQAWTEQGWVDRFGLPFDARDTGYNHDADEVAAVRTGAELLTGYHDAVHQRSLDYLRSLSDVDLDRVVDRRWDPPVTLGVRLVSVVSDAMQHVGQAGYLRGVLLRRV